MTNINKLLNYKHVYHCIGLEGTAKNDTKKSHKVWAIISFFLLILGTTFLTVWHYELHNALEDVSIIRLHALYSMLILGLYFIPLLICTRKKNYAKKNIALPLIALLLASTIIYPPSKYLWTMGLPFIALYLMIPSCALIRVFFLDGNLKTTLVATAIIIVLFGVLASIIDSVEINSPFEGMWWSVITASTVGYGDIVPKTALGKILATILIFIGMAMRIIITANFLAFVLKNQLPEASSSSAESDILKKIDKLERLLTEKK